MMIRRRFWVLFGLSILSVVLGIGVARADTTQFAEFPVPGAGELRDVAVGFDAVWLLDTDTPTGFPKIFKLDPDTGQVLASFTGPTKTQPSGGIIIGTDAVWYNLENDGSGGPGEIIGKLDPGTGLINEFDLPAGGGASRLTEGFGHIWYTDVGRNVVGRLDPDTGVVTEYSIPTANSTPVGIATGFGYVWFAEVVGQNIGRLDPNTGVITEFQVAMGGMCCGVAVGFDAVWFTIHTANLIGQLDPDSGVVTTYPIPTPGSNPLEMVAGPFNSVWFTENLGNKIGRLDPTTGGFTEYEIPTPNSNPFGIAEGSIWFVQTSINAVGRLHVDRFSDDDGPFELDIEWMAEQGITLGCNPEGTLYCPLASVTRAQMASFLVRALDLPAVAGNRFSDVSGTHTANINALAEAGVTLGCNPAGTLYCPSDEVTREQMASFLARALNLAPIPGDRFDDVSGSHEPNINAIADAEITLGCNPEGTLYCPRDFVTRGQMAAFLHRALG